MKKAFAALSLSTLLLAGPVSAQEEGSHTPFDTTRVAEAQAASFPWVAVGIIGVAVTVGLVAGLACCD